MFSGIIEGVGVVRGLSRCQRGLALKVECAGISGELKTGESVAVNGACLTVASVKGAVVSFDLLAETGRVTNLGALKPSDKVNLERSLKAGERISGHYVSGHIDCIGIIRRKYIKESDLCFEVAVPSAFIKYCLAKGSIAIDGISLTIASVCSGTVSVYIIPHTLKSTTLSLKGPSSRVNLEFDMLVKAARKN
jgi:riboflavin synthase